jgi:opacity protein-like surface antigen
MKLRAFTAVLALALVPAMAAAGSLGIGAYGGLSIPIINDTAGNGALYGLRAPVHLLPLLTIEPFYAQSSLGDVEETFGGQTYTRSGPDVKTFGANAIFNFGGGVTFYPLVGIGGTKIEQSGSEDISETSINFGLGFGFTPMPKLGVDLRGELCSVVTGDTSRKFGNLTVGVSYALFGF